ncbi:DUF3987 domain-containing protein [Marinobacter zhejiangensis]|uniref:DUF3987 domain-containing protein n=1 Tax=Marinobacter zhejiangensis TaxID=488535 RepID=UPI000B82A30E|nr:DUF3987 domain-containing protein [Marinobacter zhejiangensis]
MSDNEVAKAKERLSAHLAAKPCKPKGRQTLYEDATYQALLQGMHEQCENVCVLADEGSGTLNRLITPGMSMLNSAWSNMEIKFARKDSTPFAVTDPRLTFLLSIQPELLEEYRDRNSDIARAAGLWARTLVSAPLASTIGYRFASEDRQEFTDASNYFARIRKLLKKSLRLNEASPKRRHLLKFENSARQLYITTTNEIEANMQPGGLYENARDHASKLMENIARVSAIIHVVNGYEGDITWETLNTSIHICIYFSREYLNVFNSQPQFINDAWILNEWLTVNFRQKGIRYIGKRHARQYCSGPLRKPGRFKEALEYLECHGHIRTFKDETNTWHIDTTPTYPPITLRNH